MTPDQHPITRGLTGSARRVLDAHLTGWHAVDEQMAFTSYSRGTVKTARRQLMAAFRVATYQAMIVAARDEGLTPTPRAAVESDSPA